MTEVEDEKFAEAPSGKILRLQIAIREEDLPLAA
jgi:hypothetical protein